MYREWAQAQCDKIKNILFEARANHGKAVQERYDNVKQLSNVIDVTKDLFEVSKV